MAEAAFPRIHNVDHRMADIDPSASVSQLAAIGAPAEWRDRASRYPAIIEARCVVREFVRVHAGCIRETVVGDDTLLMAGSHVGHDVQIGEGCEVAPNAVIGGCCTIGDRVKIGMGAVILPYVEIDEDARIGAGSVVTKNVPAGETWAGNPAKRIGPKFEVGS